MLCSPSQHVVYACVWLCVCAKAPIPFSSNCEVQQAYIPTNTANHKSIVRPCRGAALTGLGSPYAQLPPTHRSS